MSAASLLPRLAEIEWIAAPPRRFVPLDEFGRAGRLELEIGFGKGRFLLKSAAERPDVDFVGIEYASKYFRMALDRARRRGLSNVRVVRTDARVFVEETLPNASLDAVHVYFPDPWPKRKQQKRRLLDPLFVAILLRKMKPGAELFVATDHEGYYGQMLASVATEPGFREGARFEEEPEGRTNYEIKYRLEGRPIYRARWVAAPGSSPGRAAETTGIDATSA